MLKSFDLLVVLFVQDDLRARAPAIVNSLGYYCNGISKGSRAAKGHSMEARANGGGVPSMLEGGITASLQSIGATGRIKPSAAQTLHDGMVRGGIKSQKRVLR